MNYLVDAAPMAMLFASICAWDALTRARSTNVRLLLSALILSTLLATSAIGFLLGVTGYEARFEKLNPQLFDRITRFLSR